MAIHGYPSSIQKRRINGLPTHIFHKNRCEFYFSRASPVSHKLQNRDSQRRRVSKRPALVINSEVNTQNCSRPETKRKHRLLDCLEDSRFENLLSMRYFAFRPPACRSRFRCRWTALEGTRGICLCLVGRAASLRSRQRLVQQFLNLGEEFP
jgi:hypothetical protein